MEPKVVVDASVWVSRLMPQDVNHDASSFWAERFTSEGGFLVAPTFLLIEVAASISRIAGDIALAKQIVEDIKSDSLMQTVPLDASFKGMLMCPLTGLGCDPIQHQQARYYIRKDAI